MAKKLEHTIVCLGLAYDCYKRWTRSDSEVKGWPPGDALLVGVCIPFVWCMYGLESALNRKTTWAYRDYLRNTGGNHGLWCSILLPVAVFLSYRDYKKAGHFSLESISEHFSSVAMISHALLATTCLWIIYVMRAGSHNFVSRLIYAFLTVTISTLCFGIGDLTLFFLGILLYFVFDSTIYSLLTMAPRSFTIGEAIIVSQGLSAFSVVSSLVLSSTFRSSKSLKARFIDLVTTSNESQQVVDFVNISLVGCAILVFSLVYVKRLRSSVGFYVTSAVIASTFIVPALYFVLNKNPLSWIWWFFTRTDTTSKLLAVWVGFVTISVLLVIFRPGTTTTVARKYFHVLIVPVFITGLLWDDLLLFYASTLFVGICCILECIRLLDIPPFGSMIRSGFASFLDEKDCGPLVVSYIYLVAGCSLPLWLQPHFHLSGHKQTSLAPFAGVIAIGIGDTVASIGGTLFGSQTWPGTVKTFMGTLLSILAQILFCFLMITYGGVQSSVLECIFPVIISSLLEAFTLQIDNLTLPLYLYVMLR